jgi:hypothetical protein
MLFLRINKLNFYQVRQGRTCSRSYKSSSPPSSSPTRFRILFTPNFQNNFLTYWQLLTIFWQFLTTFFTFFWQLLTTFWQFFANFITTFFNFLTTFWHFFDNFLKTFGQLFENFLSMFSTIFYFILFTFLSYILAFCLNCDHLPLLTVS